MRPFPGRSHPVRVRGLKHHVLPHRVWNIQSHPVRVRGLKLLELGLVELKVKVAPRAGAWIETLLSDDDPGHSHVAPRAGAWIEALTIEYAFASSSVAPRAGAWIETIRTMQRLSFTTVAPRAGAWIETKKNWKPSWNLCRTPCGCVD